MTAIEFVWLLLFIAGMGYTALFFIGPFFLRSKKHDDSDNAPQ